MKPIRTFILCFGMFPLLLPNDLHAQYHIRASVLGDGGATASNGNHRVASTVGQIFIGSAQGGNFRKQVGFWRSAHLLTPVEEISELIPTEYRLNQNFPNPFNPSTTIRYEIPKRTHVILKIFNPLGQEVETLVDGQKEPARYEVKWNAQGFSSGVYFYRLQAPTKSGQAGDPRPDVVWPRSRSDRRSDRTSLHSGQGFVETKKLILLK